MQAALSLRYASLWWPAAGRVQQQSVRMEAQPTTWRAGVVLMVPGLFGFFVAIGPNWLKVLMSGVLIYMAFRVVLGPRP